ncbi:MAG: CAP domain-containing protein [Microthrixaceae bacterium]
MSRSTTRRFSLVTALVVVVAVLATGCTKNGEAWNSYTLMNNERENRGIRELRLDDTLVNKAQAWADHMAATGTVRHSNLAQGAGTGWTVLGENVGWARSVNEMHSMFMSSSSHRGSILNGRYDRVGVGVAVRNGRFYTVQVFAG